MDYEKLYRARCPFLRKAYERSNIAQDPEYLRFLEENRSWLPDYALFMAVKGRFDGAPWTQWAEDIRLRWGFAMDYYRRELYFDIEFQQYLQFKFFQQWYRLKEYSNGQGIRIIGDIPIYVAMDSADTWAHLELFRLDGTNRPCGGGGLPAGRLFRGRPVVGHPSVPVGLSPGDRVCLVGLPPAPLLPDVRCNPDRSLPGG